MVKKETNANTALSTAAAAANAQHEPQWPPNVRHANAHSSLSEGAVRKVQGEELVRGCAAPVSSIQDVTPGLRHVVEDGHVIGCSAL